jgi:putative transposase
MKGRSSNFLRKEFPELLKMPTLWTRSFFTASIGQVSEDTVKEYIENQWKK